MQHVPLALAKEGMVLAKSILRSNAPQGPPICSKGTVLTVALIERLSRMDVTTIAVEGGTADSTPEEQAAALDRRFSRTGEDPLMTRLHTLMRNRLLKADEGSAKP